MNTRLTSFLLRTGVALSLIYAAIASFLSPLIWASFFPQWMTNIIPGIVLLTIFSIFEIILALWLLSNKKACLAGFISALLMFGIIITNLHSLDLVFRDIPILFAGLAIITLEKK